MVEFGVGSVLKSMKSLIKEGVSEASYRCSESERDYSIYFFGDTPSYHLTITRDGATFEERDPFGYTTLLMQYFPSPSREDAFEAMVFYKYCDLFKRKFNGISDMRCSNSTNPEDCPFFARNIYGVYFVLENYFIYPFLSHLLKSKFHIISCDSDRITTPHIILESSGDFTYNGRFIFSYQDIYFDISCKHPARSIRRAIRFIMKVL